MDALETWNFAPVVLTLNSLCTFALNLSVFLVISHTSALTIRVAGVVKDWVVVLLSALLFADTKLTVINLFGYGVGEYLNKYVLHFYTLISLEPGISSQKRLISMSCMMCK